MLSTIVGIALSTQIYLHQPAVKSLASWRVPVITINIINHRQNVRALPKTQTKLSVSTHSNVTVKAGDNRVTKGLVSSAANIIDETSLPILKKYVGSTPTQAVNMVLFSSPNTYGNALIKAGIPTNDIRVLTAETGGLTIGSDIWIPLYNVQDSAHLANVLTHELTHVVFNQAGFGAKMPTWLNEGAAWRDGLLAEQKTNNHETALDMMMEQSGVLEAAMSDQLLPLTASEQDILNSGYNVEYEDFMAVESLVKQYGADKFNSFLSSLSSKQDVNQAFESVYNQSMDTFQEEFVQSLISD